MPEMSVNLQETTRGKNSEDNHLQISVVLYEVSKRFIDFSLIVYVDINFMALQRNSFWFLDVV